MKWFNLKQIISEIKKVRWPKFNELVKSSVQVVIFTAFFALFFYCTQFIISFILQQLGVL